MAGRWHLGIRPAARRRSGDGQAQVACLKQTDASAKPVRRAPRIRELTKRIVSMCKRQDVSVSLLKREQVRRAFFGDAQGTKYALAEILAERFPDELGTRLPPKRRPWMSKDSRMEIFGAVALALVVRKEKP